ncbi:hypothetical protein TRFO_33775 [Tritrichomonas foetus]|uniref:Uncharacterized protein n=1 Tax=Tritrichomonas foetus TaxID=1144522 RepID=A0A1J4JKX3_9EUKA|nr:hypothetical protein TRFO_33775 [Tritrichomonas foetus]|eukprot:OHS99742.1 hypothetical protein TRFO_33775 [Tritrichomonas foetus]
MFEDFCRQPYSSSLFNIEPDDFLIPSVKNVLTLDNTLHNPKRSKKIRRTKSFTFANTDENSLSYKNSTVLNQPSTEQNANFRFQIPEFQESSYLFNNLLPKHKIDITNKNNHIGNFPLVSYDPNYVGIKGNLEQKVFNSLLPNDDPFLLDDILSQCIENLY